MYYIAVANTNVLCWKNYHIEEFTYRERKKNSATVEKKANKIDGFIVKQMKR